tara:strand:- start:7 stop:219 length:213 start_codon:yes stop_codon:yes gene_type:complete
MSKEHVKKIYPSEIKILNKIRRMNMTITKTEFLDWWGSDHENVEELTELILELLNKKYKINTCVQDIKQY